MKMIKIWAKINYKMQFKKVTMSRWSSSLIRLNKCRGKSIAISKSLSLWDPSRSLMITRLLWRNSSGNLKVKSNRNLIRRVTRHQLQMPFIVRPTKLTLLRSKKIGSLSGRRLQLSSPSFMTRSFRPKMLQRALKAQLTPLTRERSLIS